VKFSLAKNVDLDSFKRDDFFFTSLPGTPRPTIYKWMEMVISNHFLYKDLVHHPIETSIYKWLALGFTSMTPHFFSKNVPLRWTFQTPSYLLIKYRHSGTVWILKG